MVAVEIVFHIGIFLFGAKQGKNELTDSKGKVYFFDKKGQLHSGF